MKDFLKGRFKGGITAFKGALYLIKTEASIQVQTSVAILVTVGGFVYEISALEWMIQCFMIGLVLSAEGLNTAVEEIADFIHPDFHKKIGVIKDVAAGAVFFAAIASLAVICIIYYPKIMIY